MSAEDSAVGRRVVDIRTQSQMSQGDLAQKVRDAGVNWSQGTLSRVELGERPVRLTEAVALSGVLGVSILELAGRASQEPKLDVLVGMKEAILAIEREMERRGNA